MLWHLRWFCACILPGLGDDLGKLAEVIFNFTFERWLMQRRGRVIHGHHPLATDPFRLAVNGGDLGTRQVTGHRVAPQCDDHFGPDQRDLPVQVEFTGLNLLGEWVAIAGGGGTSRC